MITHIHSYIVRPEKGVAEPAALVGTSLDLTGPLFDQLSNVYNIAENECDISISFNPSADDAQFNEMRSLLIAYSDNPSLANSDPVARKLCDNTTKRSSLGLFFILRGQVDGQNKLVLSRYPADSGILANESDGELDVQLIERVFMKNRTAYKAVLYNNISADTGVWDGKAVDKQITSLSRETSGYWIKDFLQSDFVTTAAAGTRFFANAIRKAMQEVELAETNDFLPLLDLGNRLDGTPITINETLDRFAVSEAAKERIIDALSRPDLADERFVFERVIFENEIRLRLIKLSTGAFIAAPANEFENIVQELPSEGLDQRRFVLDGNIIDTAIRKKL